MHIQRARQIKKARRFSELEEAVQLKLILSSARKRKLPAAMMDLGFMGIPGYRPRGNYQALLATVAADQIRNQPTLDSAALAAVQLPAAVPSVIDFTKVKTQAPQKQNRATEPVNPLLFKAVKRDYLEREAQNQSLGLAGERFAVQFEHWRLTSLGEHKLADRVEHVSLSKGDGLGYDVLSFDADGKERFIEVKTTTYGRDTPFFVSRGGCKKFCVNGQLAGNCRLAWSNDDRREEPVTHRTDRRAAGELQET